ncbi:MAG: hypothetical protein RIQ70_683 [Bacteroidota bacterium]|jgi:nicotinamide riboside kinase
MGVVRIAFTGPESSGKTTMAKWFSEEFSATYCEEYARQYLHSKPIYFPEDLTHMAKRQLEIWNNASPIHSMVADTELLVIQIWSLWKYKSCDSFIASAVNNQQFDHYFLCKPDIPWEPDDLRESEHERDQLFDLYEQMIINLGWNYSVVSGNMQTRKNSIRNILNNMNSFANH